jgi:hypothetical protein
MGWLGATIPGSTAIIGSELGWGAAAAQDIGVMASPGVTWGSALGAGALGSLGYSTLGSAIGLPTSGYSGITSGLGAAGMSAYGGSLAGLTGIGALGGPIGIGLGALAGGLLGGMLIDPIGTILGGFSKVITEVSNTSNIFGSLSPKGADLTNRTSTTQKWKQYYGASKGWSTSWQESPLGIDFSYGADGAVSSMDVSGLIQINEALRNVTESVKGYADIIGRRWVDLENIIHDVNINTLGMSSEQIGEALVAEFEKLGIKMAEVVLDGAMGKMIDGFDGNALQTLERLAMNVLVVKDAFEKLDEGLYVSAPRISGLTASLSKTKVTSDLAEMFGGAGVFGEAVDQFFKSFYSKEDQTKYFLQTLSDSLPIAIDKIPITMEQFKEETVKWLNTYAATGDKLAGEQFKAFVAWGPEFAKLIGDEIGNKTSDLFVSALGLLGETGLAQTVSRQKILEGMESSLHPLQEFVWALEDGAQKIEDATSGLDTVRDTIASILGSEQTPQSKTFFEKRYSDLLGAAQSDPGQVSAFTGFAIQYLDFIKDYGDPKAQEKVLRDLWGLEGSLEDQVTMADEITGGKTLSDLWDVLTGMNAESILPDLSTSVGNGLNLAETLFLSSLQKYKEQYPDEYVANYYSPLSSATKEFKEGSGYTYMTPERIEEMLKTPGYDAYEYNGKTYDIGQLQKIHDLIGTVFGMENESGAYSLQSVLAETIAKLGASMADYFWNPDSVIADLSNIGFASGGSISGPMSGYTVPVTFHGKEHISTDSDMKDVKSLLQALVSQNGGIVKVYVKVGDSGEFREVVADVMRSDPETQEITRRVVNG